MATVLDKGKQNAADKHDAFVEAQLARARQRIRTLDAVVALLNWLDLRDQKLPGAIRGAVGHRAAKDLAQADLERAISGRRAAWLGGVSGGLAVGMLVALFLVGIGPFFGFLGRTFLPFAEGSF